MTELRWKIYKPATSVTYNGELYVDGVLIYKAPHFIDADRVEKSIHDYIERNITFD